MSSSGIPMRLTALAFIATASAAAARQHIAAPGPAPLSRAEIQPINGGYAIVAGVPVAHDKPPSDTLAIGTSVRIDRTLVGSSHRVVRSNRP